MSISQETNPQENPIFKPAHPHVVFNAQLLLAVLVQTVHSTKIITQLHRFMLCQDANDLADVADYCAVGKPAPIKIDHSISVVHLPGFKLLADKPTLWMQLTGALIDYVCFMSNSDIQKAYSESKAELAGLSLASPNSIQEFADTEERIYNSHCSFAAAAHRATIDHVDRGLTILTTLSSDLKKKLNKIAREEKIPENCQTRDWVIVQLEELEEIDDPDFSWFKKIWLSGRLCRDFQNGKCSYTNCKFSHDILRTPATNQPGSTAALPASMATEIGPGSARPKEDLSAPDVVDISCRSQIAPNCETNFKASPSFWNAIKNDKGESFEIPKSCTTCRRFAKVNSSSMVTSFPEADAADLNADWWIPTPDADDSSLVVAAIEVGICDSAADFDYGADDDYINDLFEGHDMSMSDAADAEM